MLTIQGLNKSYGEQNVLNDINLNVETGEIISVVGSSGSGKTTLLRLVSGLEIPESGKITINDKIVNNQNVFVAPEKRNCSLVFQDYALFPNMSMYENIYFGKDSSTNIDRVKQLIDITDIKKIMEKFPHECSGGEQQRVALVRSLAINPKIILMDEPLSNLDYDLKENLGTVIRKIIKKFNTTAIIVTHDINDAMKISDRIVVLDDGSIVQIGLPNELYNNPKSKKVALLFGETNFIPLSMIPDEKNYFIDSKTKQSFISVRPNQFKIFNKNSLGSENVFSGEIQSIKEVASKIQIELKCENLFLTIFLDRSENLIQGQELKVIVI